MKPICRLAVLSAVLAAFHAPLSTLAQGTTFTYQGRLNDGSNAASGLFDFRFILYDADAGGSQTGPILTNTAVAVSGGLFTTSLDFGASFPGADRWLEIAVRTNGSGVFTTLSPRQNITATPYAITAGSLTGVVPLAQLPGAVVTNNGTGLTLAGTFSGNGAGLTTLNASRLSSGTVPDGRLSSNVAMRNAANTFTDGPQTLHAPAGDRPALVVQGAKPQTANLQEWETSGGTVLAAVSGGGSFVGDGAGLSNLNSLALSAGPLTVQPVEQLQQVGQALDAGAYSMTISGDYLYAVGSGFRIYDISEPSTPLLVGYTNDGAHCFGFSVVGRYAYVANPDGWGTYDVADPTHPIRVGQVDETDTVMSLAVTNGYAYVAHDTGALRIYSVTNAASPVLVGQRTVAGYAWRLTVAGNYAYAGGIFGLRIYDISIPTNPVVTATIAGRDMAQAVAVVGHHLYVGYHISSVEVYDVSNPAFPALVGEVFARRNISGLAVAGDRLFVSLEGGGIGVADISDPAHPVEIDTTHVTTDFIWGVAAKGGYGYFGQLGTPEGVYAFELATVGKQVQVGSVHTPADLSVTGSVSSTNFVGSGALLTNLDARSFTTGTISESRLPTNLFRLNRILIAGTNNTCVGLGTTNPVAALDVRGPACVGSAVAPLATGASNILNLMVGINPNGRANGITFSEDASATTAMQLGYNGAGTGAANRLAIYASDNDELFTFENGGNLGIGTNNPAYPLHLASGAHVTTGGVWTDSSDRDAKENFQRVDAGQVLAQVERLPITSWNYRAEDAAVRHIGPVAQDFHAAFGVGADDRHLAALDGNGVALAAIQGLNQKLEARNAALEKEVAELRALLQRLAAKVNGETQ